jgi:pyridoxamine 5'-phosphate oxidase-like protein
LGPGSRVGRRAKLGARHRTREVNAVLRRVAFEVDSWDSNSTVGWSVVLKGVAEEVTTGIDPFSAAFRERRIFPMAPGLRERWIAVYPSEISGRRFRRS